MMDLLRSAQPGQGPSAEFDRAFRLEILRSELLRCWVLTGLFGVGLVVSLLTRFVSGLPPEYAYGSPASFTIISIIALMTLYEGVMALFLTRRAAGDRPLPPAFWYLNAIVELSAPTAGMVLLATHLNTPVHALASPATAVYFGFIALSTLRLDPRFAVFTGAVAATQYAAAVFYVMGRYPPPPSIDAMFANAYFPLQRALVLAVVGVGAAFVASELRRRVGDATRALEEERRTRDLFGQLTSPDVVQALLDDPDAARNKSTFVAVLFLDIRGFSGFAEGRSPEELVAYLNSLWEFMIEAVHDHGGNVHQILGDGFMAIFGAPVSRGNDCANAVAAARDIVASLEARARDGRIRDTRVGIGIHAGTVVAGSVGSSAHKEYKVTGDVVNLAARVEEMNKELDSTLLVTEAVWNKLPEPRPEPAAKVEMAVRGRQGTVNILRLA